MTFGTSLSFSSTLHADHSQYLVGILELACQQLDITDSERSEATSHYEAVGQWLGSSNHPLLQDALIYPQGSIRIGTATRAVSRNEIDVDLMCHLPYLDRNVSPKEVRDIVGNRLLEHGTYAQMLQPLNRGWRLIYANQFHLDITPSIDDLCHAKNGVLVPDRELQDWKASNPRDYAVWFEDIATRTPWTWSEVSEARAEVEDLPHELQFKGPLRRMVQIMKRHRDVWCSQFSATERKLAPISVIITTLASHAYQACLNKPFLNALELFEEVVALMPQYIVPHLGTQGGVEHWVANPEHDQENFADKWLLHPERKKGFERWHAKFTEDLKALTKKQGQHEVAAALAEMLDETIVKKTLDAYAARLNRRRETKSLAMKSGGIITALGANKAYAVPINKFFGFHE